MANKITWADKVALQTKPNIAAENKVTAADMNQIKTAVNETIDTMPSNLMNGQATGSIRSIGAYDETSNSLGSYAQAFGGSTTASGGYSHAEGISTAASGFASHAEGSSTSASGTYSHTEGFGTHATGISCHAEGNQTRASGIYSHAEGSNTTASGEVQHVQGKYNIEDTTSAHIVGNGTDSSKRSNAHTIDWSGNAWFAGDVYIGSTSGTNKDDGSIKLAKVTELPTKTSQLTNDSDFATNASISGSYLKLAGGTMSGAIQRAGNSLFWNTIRESNTSAGIAFTSYTGYQPVIKQKTPSGVWGVGAYTDAIHFTYFTDSSTDNNPAQLLQLQYSGAIYSSGAGLAHTFVQSSQPTAIQTGDIWFVV